MSAVIAFVGFQSSGKNTAAAALYPNFLPISFADAIKDMLAAIFCWDRMLLEGATNESRVWREQIDPWWAAKLSIPQFSPRWAMRHVGTNVMRQHFHPDLWVFNVERRLLSIEQPVVLIDVRFPNEIALVRRCNGCLIRIQRGADPDWIDLARIANHDPSHWMQETARDLLEWRDIHESEYAWIGEPVDHVVQNDGSIAELQARVVQLVNTG